MSVLSADEIRERLTLGITDKKSVIITPRPPDDAFDADAVDLRLGTHFLMPQIPPQPYIDRGGPAEFQNYLQLHVPLGDYFVLPAHQTVLGATLEYIKLPYDLSGEILTKSSVARTFMMIETAPWIHPLYRGCLTLEIANASNTAIILYPGIPIGQLVLMRISVNIGREEMPGAYVGPIYPEPPKVMSPQKTLANVGVSKYRRPVYGWVDEQTMMRELGEMHRRLSPLESAHILEALRIISENGGIARDNPALAVFK